MTFSAQSAAHRRAENALSDATYRAMLQLESGKPGAIHALSHALAEGWRYSSSVALSLQPDHQFADWLAKITPICLSMIADNQALSSETSPRAARSAGIVRTERNSPMEVITKHLDGVRFSIETRGHTILTDQPVENGGQDSAMTPPELLLASLGSCAAFYAAQYLKTRNLASSGVEVKVTAEKLKPPARLGNFQIHVACPVPLTEEQHQALTRSVHQCIVHNTLASIPQIDIHLTTPQPETQP